MTLSDKGRKLLVEWEGGFHMKPYIDSGGLTTVGCGHLVTVGEMASGKCCGEELAKGLSEDACWKLFTEDVKWAEKAVNQLVTVPLDQDQFDALVSFVFNVGRGAFKASTMLRLLNEGRHEEIPAQLGKWNKISGITVQGLVNRRNKEIDLWNTTEVA